jgi:hypothetical protein
MSLLARSFPVPLWPKPNADAVVGRLREALLSLKSFDICDIPMCVSLPILLLISRVMIVPESAVFDFARSLPSWPIVIL